jgi:hypothetical protein
MNTKNILIGGIVAGLVYFFLGYLIYGMLMMDYFNTHTGALGGDKAARDIIMSQVNRGDKSLLLWSIGIGNLGAGTLLAFVFDRAGIRNFAAGLVTGAIVGFLAAISFRFIMYGVTNLLDKDAVVVDILLYTVLSGIAGGICGMVMGKTSRPALA